MLCTKLWCVMHAVLTHFIQIKIKVINTPVRSKEVNSEFDMLRTCWLLVQLVEHGTENPEKIQLKWKLFFPGFAIILVKLQCNCIGHFIFTSHSCPQCTMYFTQMTYTSHEHTITVTF